MDIRPECVPCLMKRVLFQAKLAANGTEFAAVSSAAKVFSEEFREGRNSAEIATMVHRAAYDAMGMNDPYLDMKIRADDVAAEYLDGAKEFIGGSKDRLKAAVLVSCIGNIMDFGAGIAIDRPEEFRREFRRLLDQGIGSDDTEELRKLLERSGKAVYIFDNCGESQFDKMLIEEIRSMGVSVTGVVRGEPILNDVTANDAKRIGLDKHLDALMTSGRFAVGIDLKKIGPDLRKELNETDVIIAKGMANYESLSGLNASVPIAYILRSKCAPVAGSLGVDTDINVVRVTMPEQRGSVKCPK